MKSSEPNYESDKFPPPRDFQDTAHEKLRDGAREKHKAQILMAPTGAGKTYLGMRVIHEALKKGRRALFCCDRTTLINQTSEVADAYGLSAHGVIQAQHWRTDSKLPFQIASVQTLARRTWPEDMDVVIVDEAHTCYKSVTDYIQRTSARVIGLSATPFSRGLGNIYSNLVNAATMDELVKEGILVPMRVFSCRKPDMTGAETLGGEWTDKAAAERGAAIVGDVVKDWHEYASDRKTIVFGANIEHCEEICRQFNESGAMALTFTCHTKEEERKEILEEYKKPDSSIRILVSVEALAKGFDVKDVGCVCDCRPLRKSLSTAIQMWGRGLRSSPDTGKEDCILLDFSGNIIRFREDFEDIYFNGLGALDSGERLDKTIRKDKEEDKEESKCPRCGSVPFFKHCLACGYERKSQNLIESVPGIMSEIIVGKAKAADNPMHLWQQICAYTRSHGNPETAKGRAWYLFKDIAKREKPLSCPEFERTANAPITKATMNAIKARNIAFAKSRR